MSNLFKPSTIFAFMLYATFCYLAIIGKVKQEAVITVVASLMGFYYGRKSAKKDTA